MRIDKLYIDEFKNLKKFRIDFCEQELTSVLIGKNGSGKSNVIEALVLIFRDLDLKSLPSFDYQINYICNNHDVQIISKNRKYNIELDGKKSSMSILHSIDEEGQKIYLPKHVFAYYSGPSNRLEKHFDKHQNKFYRELLDGNEKALRPFFYARLIHSHFVLLSFFSFFDQSSKDFLKKYLDIIELESILFVLKKPFWNKKTGQNLDEFWGARGVVKIFLNDLYKYSLAPIKDIVNIPDGFSNKKQELTYLFLQDDEKTIEFARKYQSNIDFFKNLESTYISDLIYEVKIKVVKSDGTKLTFNELSEGEQQLITVLGLLKFTKEDESLFLLDEPDTHLNPAWKFEYLELLKNVVGNSETSQVIISTHDPIVIGGLRKEQVTIFSREDDGIVTKQPDIDLKGMGVAALLTSELFGLTSTLDLETQDKINKKRELMFKENKTMDDISELEKISDELGSLDFTRTTRDPLYEKFLRALYKRDIKNNKRVLTPEEVREQERIAEEIFREIMEDEGNALD
ncbi:AAA family ATPase [Paenibacillus sp. FSL R5-0490]|uniref:AAA family ATPase n=1 Tax=Paenibacillus sp. FSL R5-0490 TaxID=1920424 RepID=UPI0030D1575E